MAINKLHAFARFAWGVLAYNVLVVLWGAFVRATGSGAGCGSHWPLCNGAVVPRAPQVETIIEFTHRLSSGLALFATVGLIIWAFRRYPRAHTVRRGAAFAMGFMLVETLIGAGLVLFQLVAYNTSLTRAVFSAVHLVNTFLLLAALTLTAWYASDGRPIRLRGQGILPWLLGLGAAGMLLLGASGGVAALGNTLFPSETLAEGLRQDINPAAHVLIRLRVLHPVIAILVGFYVLVVARYISRVRPTELNRRLALIVVAIFVIQLVAGAINVALLAPVWMQLLHLLLADLLWIVMVILAATALASPEQREVSSVATTRTPQTKSAS